MNKTAVTVLWAIAALAIPAPRAAAQPIHRPAPAPVGRPAPTPATMSENATDLRGLFGVEKARRLVRSLDADERLRGIERAAALGTPEGVALLVQQLDPSSTTRGDARAKIAIARGLAEHADQPVARAALLQLVDLATPRSSQRTEPEDPFYTARVEIARRVAALALARSGESHAAVEPLVAIARGATVGAAAAAEALAAYPPNGSAMWAKPMSAAVAKLVGRTGDLRAEGALLEAVKGTARAEAPAKGAAIEALGSLGDARVLPIATASLADDDPHVRTAATRALVALGAPEAPHAVEALLADDVTAGYAIELAMVVHSAGIVHALAARGAIAADVAVRAAVVAALGRDPTEEGIEALVALLKDPMLRGDVANAIARSPCGAAMRAIEHLAASPASRRTGARAYVVRALVRGETSSAMERTLGDLAGSTDARDRAVGAFGRITLGESEAIRWLDDGDPGVRRAAAMAAMQRETSGTRAALLARRAREEDAATRTVLAGGLASGDPGGQVPTRSLVACTRGGGADVPMCALALAARASPAESAEVDALLSSPDAIVRAHAARGLASSDDPTRGGRLSAAYAYEPEPLVRRAILASLASVPREAPSVAETVALAARLDPDPEIRWTASRLAASRPASTGDETDIAWLHLVDPGGAPPPAGATGALLRADGLAVPIAFDADGEAIVPGVPPGSARLLLAPRLDAAYTRPQ